MTTYEFRIRFELHPGVRLGFEDSRIVLNELDGGPCLRLQSGKRDSPIQDSSGAVVVGGPYPSYDEAQSVAVRVKSALLLWAVKEKLGVEFGDGPGRGGITEHGMRNLEEELGITVRNEVPGIDVYEMKENLVFVRSGARAELEKGGEAFRTGFNEILASSPELNDKVQLAMELYCSSFFDASPRSRFITLVTALEALIDPQDRTDDAIGLVADLQRRIETSSLSPKTEDSLRGSLERLKRESIGQAGKRMSRELLGGQQYAGLAAAIYFTHCYALRSQILHRGRPDDDETELLHEASTCQQFVRDILLKAAGMSV